MFNRLKNVIKSNTTKEGERRGVPEPELPPLITNKHYIEWLKGGN